MDDHSEFQELVNANIKALEKDQDLQALSRIWVRETSPHKYTYNFSWLGRPIIQFPQDIIAMQELIWTIQPQAIIETGIARGGSLIFHASMLELIGSDGFVIGIDIDIRQHNRAEIEKHRMSKRIRMIQGSSIDPTTIQTVTDAVAGLDRVLVILDSNHTHEHVLQELINYGPLVKRGGYLIVLDTIIEDMPENHFPDRPWGRGNNPKTAIHEFLKGNDRFTIDKSIENKLLITVAPDGYLKCVKD
ncbi:MAG TPA: cephalosporin hydroxylase family protein [Terriglobales bacterium]|nr:cephalosporin hydroxylase family protein [Terriglobales bacterium]